MLGHISASSLGSIAMTGLLLEVVTELFLGTILMCDDPALPTAGTHFGTAHFGVDKYEPSA
jgi:hypothetical protein